MIPASYIAVMRFFTDTLEIPTALPISEKLILAFSLRMSRIFRSVSSMVSSLQRRIAPGRAERSASDSLSYMDFQIGGFSDAVSCKFLFFSSCCTASTLYSHRSSHRNRPQGLEFQYETAWLRIGKKINVSINKMSPITGPGCDRGCRSQPVDGHL